MLAFRLLVLFLYVYHTLAKSLIIVPGHSGIPARAAHLRDNIIPRYPPEEFDCIIFVHPSPYNVTDDMYPTCTVYHAQQYLAGFVHYVRPMFIARKNYDFVFMHSDDITVQPEFNPSDLKKFATMHELDVVTPIILSCYYSVMNREYPFENKFDGRLTNFIELDLTVFTRFGWTVFWDLVNHIHNPVAWGFDVCMHDLTGLRMGILDSMVTKHHREDSLFSKYDGLQKSERYMVNWLKYLFDSKDMFNKSCWIYNEKNGGWHSETVFSEAAQNAWIHTTPLKDKSLT